MSINKAHLVLVEEIKTILNNARQQAVSAINSAMGYAYWEIGTMIVEEEQKGEDRTKYGTYLLKDLATSLSLDFGKNFDTRELRRIRQFFYVFQFGTHCVPNWKT